MRPWILLSGLLCLGFGEASVAQVVPPASDTQKAQADAAHVHPLSLDGVALHILSPAYDDRALQWDEKFARGGTWKPGTLSIGPLSMDIGTADVARDGRPAHFARIHMSDFRVLGGDVSGTFDGRAATIRLSWPTGR